MILTNPVVISVICLAGMCLIKIPVFFALILSAVIAGVVSGLTPGETMVYLVDGMGGNSNTALSYILLGALAYCINYSGAAQIIARKIGNIVKDNKFVLCLIVILVSMASGTIIPVHIAFIPILIPPLIGLMNRLHMDRRMLSVCFGFGLKAPYLTVPIAYGAIFHDLIIKSFGIAGLKIDEKMILSTNWIVGLIMLGGLILSLTILSRDRQYEDKPILSMESNQSEKVELKHYLVLLSGVITLGVQLLTNSLPLGAMCGLIFILATRIISWDQMQEMLDGGIQMMGFIAFVMLVAAGYANVILNTGAVEQLVEVASTMLVGSKIVTSLILMLLGLLITLGIGTSFGTVPVISAIYVPLAMNLGYSPRGIILLVTIAAACGDAGSPASDTTLGPTAGLGIDKQHDHIWDTCIPQFLTFGVPMILVGSIITYFL